MLCTVVTFYRILEFNLRERKGIRMTSRTVCVGNNVTDISMMSAQFVQKACEFKSNVMIEIDHKKYVNGKSLMGMLSLKVHEGMMLHIMSDGADEEQAVETLGSLFGGISA